MKKYDVQKFELLSNEQIADGIFDMRVKNDELAPLAKCGQFAHVYVPSKTLRRPISVCDSENGVLRLVYQVKGLVHLRKIVCPETFLFEDIRHGKIVFCR